MQHDLLIIQVKLSKVLMKVDWLNVNKRWILATNITLVGTGKLLPVLWWWQTIMSASTEYWERLGSGPVRKMIMFPFDLVVVGHQEPWVLGFPLSLKVVLSLLMKFHKKKILFEWPIEVTFRSFGQCKGRCMFLRITLFKHRSPLTLLLSPIRIFHCILVCLTFKLSKYLPTVYLFKLHTCMRDGGFMSTR